MSKEREVHPKIYPERPGSDLSPIIDSFSRDPEFMLKEDEKTTLFLVESKLTKSTDLAREEIPGFDGYSMKYLEGERIEGIEHAWRTQVNSVEFFTDYFLTEKGLEDLRDNLGYHGNGSRQDIEWFLCGISYVIPEAENPDEKDSAIRMNNNKLVKDVSARSRSYAIDRMVNDFSESGFEVVETISNPSKLTVIKNPDKLVQKVTQLTGYKRYLKAFSEQFDSEDSNFNRAMRVICEIHSRKLNEIIVEQYPDIVNFIEQQVIARNNELYIYDEELREVLKNHRYERLLNIALSRVGLNESNKRKEDVGDRMFERLDKFINGVGVKHDEGAEYSVISQQARDLVSQSEEMRNKKDVSDIVFKDVDYDKFATVTVNAKTQQEWIERFLKENGWLSNEDPKTFNSDRNVPAADGLWQAVISPDVESFSVNGKQQVIVIPKSYNRPIASVSPTGAVPVSNHESAHVVQHENKKKVGLSIMEEVGMDRADVYAEAGAVLWETETYEKEFGIENPKSIQYLQAIERRYKGGTLKDCAKAFYDSTLSMLPEDKVQVLDQSEKKKMMRLAIDRSMRIFRHGGIYANETHHLSNSQPLVYLEQELVAQQLQKSGLTKLLYIGRSNLTMLAELHRVGLLDLTKITIPERKLSEIVREDVRELLESN